MVEKEKSGDDVAELSGLFKQTNANLDTFFSTMDGVRRSLH